MKILVIGSGGREHALAWKLAQSPRVSEVLVAPGNAGTASEPRCRNVAMKVTDIDGLLHLAQTEAAALTVVGPEVPLVAGVVDRFRAAGLRIFGPSAAAAQLEGSKAYAKDFLARHGIPTAFYAVHSDVDAALAYVRSKGAPIVIKADGLAAGKGVIVAMTLAEAEAAVRDMLEGNAFGDAGARVVIEEFLDGEEASFISMVDGRTSPPPTTRSAMACRSRRICRRTHQAAHLRLLSPTSSPPRWMRWRRPWPRALPPVAASPCPASCPGRNSTCWTATRRGSTSLWWRATTIGCASTACAIRWR